MQSALLQKLQECVCDNYNYLPSCKSLARHKPTGILEESISGRKEMAC